MTESSVSVHANSFSQSPTQKQNPSQSPDITIPSTPQKLDQFSSQQKQKNVLQSQLTQQHSGISYAFKAHLMILTFERIKTRKILRCFGQLKKEGTLAPFCEILAAGDKQKQGPKNNIPKYQQSKQELLNEQRGTKTCITGQQRSELPYIGFLEQLDLKNSHKFLLNKELFQSKVKTNLLQKKINVLQEALREAQRRQERQMIKKRESLESLAQELGEKNEVIEELKTIIKGLKTKLSNKLNGTGSILEEDSDSLRRSLLHMQGVNDRLNYDLSKMKQQQRTLTQQIKALTSQNERLKGEIFKLKEEVFVVDSLKEQAELSRKECTLWERRLKQREERLNVLQRRLNEQSRSKLGQNIGENYFAFCTQKKFVNLSTSSLTNEQKMKQSEYIAKIQAIFGYLFHIQDPKHTLHSIQLFDEEQRQLLQSQKLKIMNVLQSSSKSQTIIPLKSKKLEIQEQSSIVNHFGCTILELIERQSRKPQPIQTPPSSSNDLKYVSEITRLREKISQLKDQQLFIRSVLLSFIKSLQLRSLKKQSQNILELLFQAFEYSEEQRRSILQSKSRKIFGFI